MSTLLQDSFIGTNGTALPSHTMDVGSGWAAVGGQSSFEIQTNSCRVNTASSDTYQNIAAIGQADYTLTLDWQIDPNGGSNHSGQVRFRYVDESNYWAAYIYASGSFSQRDFYLQKIVAGVPTNVTSADISSYLGLTKTLTIILNGNSISIQIGAISALTTTDADLNTATHMSLFQFYAPGSGYGDDVFSNLLVTGTAGGGAGSNTNLYYRRRR